MMGDMPPSAGHALVTGAARRIGRALALDLAEHGWNVVIHYRRSEVEAREVLAAVQQHGVRGAIVQADLAREEDTSTLIERAAQALDAPLTLLVNNASVFERDALATSTRASWDLHMETNLRAPAVLTQGFARMLPQGGEGLVVHLVDHLAETPGVDFFSYALSKAALWSLTRMQAVALAPRIRVNAIGPGLTLPSRFQTPESFEKAWRSMPLGRGTSPDEIAAALRFLLQARSMTGQMLVLDGGEFLRTSAQ